jgi:multiple sugar transport system permease protein
MSIATGTRSPSGSEAGSRLRSGIRAGFRPRRRRRNADDYASVWIHLIALGVIAVALLPIVWMIIASISPPADLLSRPLRWIPRHPDFSRYNDVFTGAADSPAGAFRRAMLNSLLVAAGTVALSLVVGILGGYAFARLRFAGRQVTLLVFLSTYMLPPISLVIPLYLILVRLHLLDSVIGLIIVYSSFCTPFVLWTLSGYFAGIPVDLEEAARLDGCSRIGVLWRIILPLSKPGIFSAILFATLLCWDEFLYALIFTNSAHAKTIPVAIAEFSAKFSTDFGLVCVGGLLAAIPPVVVALAFQRFVVSGLMAGAVKG